MKDRSKLNIYRQAQHFADVTKLLLATGNIQRAKKCLEKAEDIYVNGTAEIKHIISNIYLFSVSGFMEMNHFNLKELLPANLKSNYYKQVYSSGL